MCLTRLPVSGINSTIPRNALRKNASGVAMRMKIRQSKTPQLTWWLGFVGNQGGAGRKTVLLIFHHTLISAYIYYDQ